MFVHGDSHRRALAARWSYRWLLAGAGALTLIAAPGGASFSSYDEVVRQPAPLLRHFVPPEAAAPSEPSGRPLVVLLQQRPAEPGSVLFWLIPEIAAEAPPPGGALLVRESRPLEPVQAFLRQFAVPELETPPFGTKAVPGWTIRLEAPGPILRHFIPPDAVAPEDPPPGRSSFTRLVVPPREATWLWSSAVPALETPPLSSRTIPGWSVRLQTPAPLLRYFVPPEVAPAVFVPPGGTSFFTYEEVPRLQAALLRFFAVPEPPPPGEIPPGLGTVQRPQQRYQNHQAFLRSFAVPEPPPAETPPPFGALVSRPQLGRFKPPVAQAFAFGIILEGTPGTPQGAVLLVRQQQPIRSAQWLWSFVVPEPPPAEVPPPGRSVSVRQEPTFIRLPWLRSFAVPELPLRTAQVVVRQQQPVVERQWLRSFAVPELPPPPPGRALFVRQEPAPARPVWLWSFAVPEIPPAGPLPPGMAIFVREDKSTVARHFISPYFFFKQPVGAIMGDVIVSRAEPISPERDAEDVTPVRAARFLGGKRKSEKL